MLTFKRGGSWFFDRGQIYLKLLPDGEAVQLTHDDRAKMSPVFSPDGSRIAYTADEDGWAIWEVPVLAGGEPRRMLANAEGLRWIDPRHILFSRIATPPHMIVEISEESLAGIRDVYAPASHYGMAHFSVASPDRKQVLIVEMQTDWISCRLVPFDGSSKGKPVGPVPASCTAAAWSPDGKWMYFTANTGQGSHLWRQKSDGGPAEQISRGPTTEQGIAMASDGRSLITSVATSHSSVWIHDAKGDRQISSEGNTAQPYISPDGRIFYLAGQIGGVDEMSLRDTELWAADPNSGRSARVLPGEKMAKYVVSPGWEGGRLVDRGGRHRRWRPLVRAARSADTPAKSRPKRRADNLRNRSLREYLLHRQGGCGPWHLPDRARWNGNLAAWATPLLGCWEARPSLPMNNGWSRAPAKDMSRPNTRRR